MLALVLVALAFVWLFACMAVGFKFEGVDRRGLGPPILISIVVAVAGFAAIFTLAVDVQ